MKRVKWLPCLCLSLLALLVLSLAGSAVHSGTASADSSYESSLYTFYFEEYDVTYDVASNRKIAVTEELTVMYTGRASTGFIQYIPVNAGELIRNVSVWETTGGAKSSVPYEVYSETITEGLTVTSYLCLDIGDTSVKTNTRHVYRISYDYCLTKAQEGDDMLSLNAIGFDRETTCTIENASVTMVLPDGYLDGQCYVGAAGSRNVASFTQSETEDGRVQLTLTGLALAYNEGVTFTLSFKEGALTTYFDFTPYVFIIAGAILFLVLIAVKLLFFSRSHLTPIVNFEAPDSMDPLIMGKLIDNKVNSEDITAMIYYWADKGYVKINLDDTEDPTIIRLVRDLPAACEPYESLMFREFFANFDAVKPSMLKNSFYHTVERVTSMVNAKTKGLYESKSVGLSVIFALLGGLLAGATPLIMAVMCISSSYIVLLPLIATLPALVLYAMSETVKYNSLKLKKSRQLVLFLGIAALAAVCTAVYTLLVPSWILGTAPKILLCLVSAVIIGFAVTLITRTPQYTTQLNQIVGFRNFILLAEKDRLEAMLEQDPQFYYHILPYAQVLGVSDKWEEKFRDITVPPPYWATSANGSLAVTMLEFHAINSLIRRSAVRMTTNMISRPSSSGGSGFGGFGGGHVGGGHGGGGFRGR